LQQHNDIRGVSAHTVGLIKRDLYLIDEEFRQNPRNHRLFLSILRAPAGVTHELRRMNRYGVLGLYIPSFGRVVGRMQYDLFHAYTVDEHTLFVVNNLRRFALSRFDHEFPHCSPLMQSFDKPEIVYTRRSGRGVLLPRARHEPVRCAHRRVAGQASPCAVDDRPEKRHQ
jgi:[protein-PII] uridylyltransferase